MKHVLLVICALLASAAVQASGKNPATCAMKENKGRFASARTYEHLTPVTRDVRTRPQSAKDGLNL
jgi:hypothetical protein